MNEPRNLKSFIEGVLEEISASMKDSDEWSTRCNETKPIPVNITVTLDFQGRVAREDSQGVAAVSVHAWPKEKGARISANMSQ